jgi:diguanylate cyclase (GGDEF)-like protein/PAS domain S-box-containing protein
VMVDITQRKAAEERLQVAASVFSHASEGIMITDPAGTIIDVNQAFCQITGYAHDEVIGCNARLLNSGHQDKTFYATMWGALKTQGEWTGEVWNRRKSGEVYSELLSISAVHNADGQVQRYVALFSDITKQKEYEARLVQIAHFDALTGLPNRMLLADRLRQAMVLSLRSRRKLAVLFLDLDGFKTINDTYGHETGDRLLIALSVRMRDTLRDGDTLARIGGDEFVGVLVGIQDPMNCVDLLERLRDAAAQPVQVDGHWMQVSASIGVAFYPQDEGVDAEQLLRQADQAMYQAKVTGKNRFHIFDAAQDRDVRLRHENLEHVVRAIDRNELVLHYQPKVNMRTGEVLGAEALIRWQHPQDGLLMPGAFLPALEGHPLTVRLGCWVLEQAVRQIAAWKAQGLHVPISVNVDAQQLNQVGFVEDLRALLRRHPQVEPGDLELEILETSALSDIAQVSSVIVACREIGVSFALDDFGTGYSSLNYLRHLPARMLKIDQSFVRDMLVDPEDLAILDGVIGLSVAFRRRVIAEGVETAAHGQLLLRLGCDWGQGYAIARPMPAEDMPAWVATWQPDPDWKHTPRLHREDLPLLFATVEVRAWVHALAEHLRGERERPPEGDPTLCHFGRWLEDAQGGQRYADHLEYPEMVALHDELHHLGDALLALPSDEALRQLDALQDVSQRLQRCIESLESVA